MEQGLEIVLSLITAIATGVISYITYKLKKYQEHKDTEENQRRQTEMELEQRRQDEYNALRASLLALTRDRILQGYRYYRREGGISTQDLETMGKLYSAYHTLGGNGTITAVYEKILVLPLKEE